MKYFLESASYFLNNYVQVNRGQSPYLIEKSPELRKAAENPQILRSCWEYTVEKLKNSSNSEEE